MQPPSGDDSVLPSEEGKFLKLTTELQNHFEIYFIMSETHFHTLLKALEAYIKRARPIMLFLNNSGRVIDTYPSNFPLYHPIRLIHFQLS